MATAFMAQPEYTASQAEWLPAKLATMSNKNQPLLYSSLCYHDIGSSIMTAYTQCYCQLHPYMAMIVHVISTLHVRGSWLAVVCMGRFWVWSPVVAIDICGHMRCSGTCLFASVLVTFHHSELYPCSPWCRIASSTTSGDCPQPSSLRLEPCSLSSSPNPCNRHTNPHPCHSLYQLHPVPLCACRHAPRCGDYPRRAHP